MKANVRDSIPNGLPQNTFHGWVSTTTQFVNDSGTVFKFNDTASKVKLGYGAIKFFTDHKPYYWDGTGWRGFAAPSTGFVKYSDSATLYVTLTRLKDSLGHYVTLATNQTITGEKIFNANQTFNDSVEIDANFAARLPAKQISRITVNDSLKNYSSYFPFAFKSNVADIGIGYRNMKSPQFIEMLQKLQLKEAVDTLYLQGDQSAPVNIMSGFTTANNTDDTLNVTTIGSVKSTSLKSLSVGVAVTEDSALIVDKTKHWNLDIPFSIIYAYTSVTNHGSIRSVKDLDIGVTDYLDQSLSDSLFKVKKHYGLYIQDIKGNPINDTSYAIYQVGRNDSIMLNSQGIQTPNIPSSNLGAYRLQMDANFNWIKKSYIPPVVASLDFPSTDATGVSDLTVTVTGAAAGDIVTLGVPNGSVTATASYFGWVSAANVVTVRFSPKATENPNTGSFTVFVTPK